VPATPSIMATGSSATAGRATGPFILGSVESETEVATAEEPVRPGRSERHQRRRAYQHPLVAILAVTALAAGLRFYHLSTPPTHVFDEVYYAKDACYDAGFPFRECKLKAPGEQTFTVHPPLGRWIMAGGVAAYGNNPFGWRVASAFAGTLSVLLLALLALKLFASTAWAAVAGLLLATESLHFVQSRIGMIDIFVTMFAVAGFLFLVLDREWIERRTPALEPLSQEGDVELLELPPDRPPSPIFRPWRLAAGLALGMAAASKWSGIPPLLVAIVLSLAWERSRRRRLRLERPLIEAVRDESFGIFWFLVMLPVGVYMASYANWFWANGIDLGGWWDIQRGMASFSLDLRAKHPYASRAWTWLVMERPVAYYYRCIGQPASRCLSSEILAIGNPVIFWGSVLALPYTMVAGILRRDWRVALILMAFAVQYFPWFLPARTTFFFYMAPMTPFMVLAFVYALRDSGHLMTGLTSRWRWNVPPVPALVVLVSIAAFFFFYPVLTGQAISHSTWQMRMWFRSWI
jgi:dolichyl-phosphate-mannose-protein mannosyltransferase